MRHLPNGARCQTSILIVMAAIGIVSATANGAVNVIGTQYQEDMLFQEYKCIYNYSNYPTSCDDIVPGSNAHLYLKNTGASAVTITDVNFAGFSLETVLKLKILGENNPYSIYFYWDNPPAEIINAGEPVWYRCDPNPIPAGGTAQVVIRLRYVPTVSTVSIGAVHATGTATGTMTVDSSTPAIASVGFHKDLASAYIHWRRSGGAAPTTILVDDVDVTAYCTTVSDSNVNFAVTEYTPSSALGNMSYHVYKGIYSDGKTATASLRSWINKFSYGTYGAGPTDSQQDGRDWIDGCNDRGVNLLIWNNGSEGLTDLLNTTWGQQYAGDRWYGFMVDYPHKWNCDVPRFWYMRDEPDAHDYHLGCGTGLLLPCPVSSHNVGTLATYEDRTYALYRTNYPQVPTAVNVDATFMPYNYYNYGQLTDVGMSDPYYQSRQCQGFFDNTNWIPLFEKATYIYAVTRAHTAACEPNPTLIAMMSCGDTDETLEGSFPYPDPNTKRTEAYYALGGGAKNMGYWWFLGDTGLGTYTEKALALWKEIGILGNEFRTAQPVIVLSHPVDMTVSASTNLWVRPLASSVDSVMLVMVNEDLVNDIDGICQYTAINNATATVTLPSWLTSCSAFEISADGVSNVTSSLSGNQLTLSLGTVEISRLIVLTTNATLRQTVEQRYLEKCHRGLCAFASEHCNTQAQCIQSPGGEETWRGNGGGLVADGWWEWETTFATVTGYKEESIVRSGNYAQRVKVYYAGGTSGGMFQRVPSANNQAYTVSAYVYADAASTSCYVGVDPAGGTSATSAGINWSSASTSQSWVQKTVSGTATSNFITVFYKVVSPDSNTHNGYFDDATPSCSAPSITTNPSNSTICPGSNTSFSVAASAGSGTISYQWQRNGATLVNGGHYSGVTTATVAITGADTNDSGNYTCVVTSAYGTATSNAGVLAFTSAITQNPVATGVCLAANTTLSVTAVGASAYQWQKNSVNMSNGGHYSGVTTATLAVTGADTNDVADYRCVVTGTCGTHTSTQAALTIKTATAITGQPTAQDVVPTTTVQFTVTVAGAGTITYQWQKDSANISDGGDYSGCATATLAIANCDTNDEGNYRCVVAADCGSVTSNQAALTIQAGTFIIEQPEPQNLCTGGNAQFDIVAFGDGTLTYQWQKNSANISDGGHYSGCTTATLVVTGADTNDMANYRCVATGDTGSATSNQAYLMLNEYTALTNGNFEASTAAYPPVGWTTYLQSTKSGAFTIQTATPPEGTQWHQIQVFDVSSYGGVYQNMTGLASGAVYTISGSYKTNSNTATASVRYSLTGDTSRANSTQLVSTISTSWGTFSGTVTATGGTITLFLDHLNSVWTNKASGFDNVKFGYLLPTITQQPSAQDICVGEDAWFTVGVSGGGTFAYQWQKDGANLSDGGHYSGCTTSALVVSDADTNDEADYRCLVAGSCGSATSDTAALTVSGTATTITGQPSAQSICAGANAQFSVTASGEGTLLYQWQKDQANMADGGHYSGVTTATLTITGADVNDVANYRCLVTGSCNSVVSDSADLSLKTSTSITQNPSDKSISAGGNADFVVGAIGDGTLTYQWQKDSANISDGGHYSGCTTATLSVTNADTNDVAYYRCVVTANCGSATSNVAFLSLSGCVDPTMVNGNFEYSTAATPPYGWTTYIQASKSGAFTIQTVTPPEGTQWQQTQVFNTGAYGGVYQNITGLTSGVIYTISGSYKSNSVSSSASVRYNLSGNTDRTSSTEVASTSSTSWGTFSDTVTASGTSMTLFLDHVNGAYTNKAAGFDNVKVTGCGAPSGPVFTQHPSAQNVCPGANAQFSVAATGTGTLTYLWQQDGYNLSNGGHYSGCTTATLAVTGADTNDVAGYRCVVTDDIGSATSNEAALTLKSATTITQHPSAQNVNLGGNAQFTVAATGDGSLTYQWQKDNANVSDGGHYSGCTTATLAITSVDTNDEADYRCVVTGGCGSATSNNAALTINSCTPPTLTNGNFEYGTAANPPYSWTTYVQAAKSAAWTIQTTTPPEGTQWQQTQVATKNGYAGIRQNVTGLTSGTIYTISGSYKTNATTCTASVRYNLSANTDRVNSTVLVSKSATSWGTFSQNITATGGTLTLFLDQTTGSAANKTAGFDNVKVSCAQ